MRGNRDPKAVAVVDGVGEGEKWGGEGGGAAGKLASNL